VFCLSILPEFKVASMAAHVTSTDVPSLEGRDIGWNVADLGEGVSAPPDIASLIGIVEGAEEFGCDRGFPIDANDRIHITVKP
jgi:hypothetical protein